MFTANHYNMNLCAHYTRSSIIILYDYPTFSLFYCLACGIFSLTAIIGNSIVFYAFWISGSLNQASKMLLLSLAASDLGIGLMVLPLNAVLMSQTYGLVRSNKIIKDQNVMATCPLLKATIFLSTFFCGASLMTVGTISIHRYLSLLLHLRYRQLVTLTRIRTVLATIWITSFLAAMLEILLVLNAIINTSGVVLVISIASFAYWKIYTIALRHQNQICVQDAHQNQICQLTQFARAKKMATKTFSIFVVLVICNAPSIVTIPMFLTADTPSSLLILFTHLSIFLIFFNACLNPVVYCWKISEVRKICGNILKLLLFRKCLQSGHQ